LFSNNKNNNTTNKRSALQQALHHTSRRDAFGARLIAQPLMRNVLCDLCVEAEAHTLMALRMAAAFDRFYATSFFSSSPLSTSKTGASSSLSLSLSFLSFFLSHYLSQFSFSFSFHLSFHLLCFSFSFSFSLSFSFSFSSFRFSEEAEKDLFRLGVSVSKYFVTKRSPAFVYECLEAHGGNGFVEDFPMAKLFRHSPLNSIWEGSGNVIALDILRGLSA
jgi:alkylation response protein AidB-like acyl-CoA dehydrogenase